MSRTQSSYTNRRFAKLACIFLGVAWTVNLAGFAGLAEAQYSSSNAAIKQRREESNRQRQQDREESNLRRQQEAEQRAEEVARRTQEATRRTDEATRIRFAQVVAQFEPNPKPLPLHGAARDGDLQEMLRLLSSGANANEADPLNGWRPLHYAAAAGQLDAAKMLMEHRASVSLGTIPGQFSPLMFAARNRHPDMVRLLITCGAGVRAVDANGSSALHYAADGLDEESIELLLANGCGVALGGGRAGTPMQRLDSARTRLIQDVYPSSMPSYYSFIECPICSSMGGDGPRRGTNAGVGPVSDSEFNPSCKVCRGTKKMVISRTLHREFAEDQLQKDDIENWHGRCGAILKLFSPTTKRSPQEEALRGEILQKYRVIDDVPAASQPSDSSVLPLSP